MHRFIFAILIVSCLCSVGFAQDDARISEQIRNDAAKQRVKTALESARQLYRSHRYASALSVLEDMREMPEVDRVPDLRGGVLFGIGCLHSLLGEQQLAIEWLREAVAAGLTDYGWYADEPDLDPIRLEPEFRSLMSEVRQRDAIKPLRWDQRKAQAFALSSDPSTIPNLARVVAELNLKNLPSDTNTEYDKLLRVAKWVSAQWQACDESAAGTTTAVAELGPTCSEHASVMAGAAQACGMRARVVQLLPRDTERRPDSHAVAEVWLESFHKWALADGQYGIVPEVNGVPLNTLELQNALASGHEVTCGTDALTCVRWNDWVLQYLYYFQYGHTRSATGGISQVILIPTGAAQPHSHNGDKTAFERALFVSNAYLLYVPANTDARP